MPVIGTSFLACNETRSLFQTSVKPVLLIFLLLLSGTTLSACSSPEPETAQIGIIQEELETPTSESQEPQTQEQVLGTTIEEPSPEPTPSPTPSPSPKPTPSPSPEPSPLPSPVPSPIPTQPPAPTQPPVVEAAQAPPAPAGFKCSCSKTCGNMASCDEAYFQLNNCGCSKRDGDGDGVPCESMCPGG